MTEQKEYKVNVKALKNIPPYHKRYRGIFNIVDKYN